MAQTWKKVFITSDAFILNINEWGLKEIRPGLAGCDMEWEIRKGLESGVLPSNQDVRESLEAGKKMLNLIYIHTVLFQRSTEKLTQKIE